MLLISIHCSWCFLIWCHIWVFFHVTIIPIGACYDGVSHHKFISVHPSISCWIQLWFIVTSFSFLSGLFLLMSTVLCQACICCYQGLDSFRLKCFWFLTAVLWCWLYGWVNIFLKLCPWPGFPFPWQYRITLWYPCLPNVIPLGLLWCVLVWRDCE